MTGPDHDSIRRNIGVYVLGALPPDERDTFEQHLSECASCRDEVASLAVLPSLLHRLDPNEVVALEVPASAGVVKRLAVERRRTRRRELVLTLAAVVATVAAAAVLAAGALPGAATAGRPYVDEAGEATATVEERAWGMAVRIEAQALPRRGGYVAVAVAEDGHRAQVASWSHTGRPVKVDGACYLAPDEVERLEIRAAPEEEVLLVLEPAPS